jgi:superfamily I DNA and RNA helicase
MKDGGLEKYVRESAKCTLKLSRELAEWIVGLLTRSATAKMKPNESNKLPVSTLTKQMDGLVQSREELLPLLVHSPSQYMYVTGGAGTGKTWLAKSYVKQYAASFKSDKILFVCFNRLLAASLRLDSELSQISNLNIVNIHGAFWEDRIDEGYRGKRIKIAPLKTGAKIDFTKTGDDLGYSMQDSLNPAVIPSLGYDCIVVDEAQDLCEGMFAFLVSLLRQRDKGKIFICAGNEQNIYGGNEVVQARWFGPNVKFDSSNTLRLTRNLRNSASIHRYCKLIVGDKNTQSGVAYKGPDCQIEKSSITLAKMIENLKEREGLENGDIAVLTDKADALEGGSINGIPWIRYQSGASDLKQVSAQLADWHDNKGIWLSTLHAFKGLESACVIVYLKNKNTDPVGVYVATTRAKYRLIIMPNDTGLRVDKPANFLKCKK